MYCSEIGECEYWAVSNLATSINPNENDIANGTQLSKNDIANAFAAFCYACTGVNKYNHIETKFNEHDALAQDILVEELLDDWKEELQDDGNKGLI